MPPQTVTLYTLLAMSAVVMPAHFLSISSVTPTPLLIELPSPAWGALICLTLATFFSRLTLFVGIKHLGGMQTALLGLSELLVTIFVAYIWLGERFTGMQWAGTILLLIALLLIGMEKIPSKKISQGGWLSWLRPPGLSTEFPLQPHE
jgi:drug/metabolite transporter (DMT)-like permease